MDSTFSFCPKCGRPLVSGRERLIDCKKCGFHLYLSPASTNALILENERGEILLTKRKLKPKKGFWDLPGGFVDFKETVEESLIREIKEELGIKLKEIKYFGTYWSYYPYKGVRYQTLCHAYSAKYGNERIKTADDVAEYRFFPRAEIPFGKLSFRDIESALKDFLLVT